MAIAESPAASSVRLFSSYKGQVRAVVMWVGEHWGGPKASQQQQKCGSNSRRKQLANSPPPLVAAAAVGAAAGVGLALGALRGQAGCAASPAPAPARRCSWPPPRTAGRCPACAPTAAPAATMPRLRCAASMPLHGAGTAPWGAA